MKRKWFVPMVVTISLCCSVTAMAQHIYVGDGVEKVVTYDETGRKVITLIFDPAKIPEEVKTQLGLNNTSVSTSLNSVSTEQKSIQPIIPKLAEPPKEGEVLAKIQYIDEKGVKRFTKPYGTYAIGQCTWYAGGRFQEVYGIPISINGRAKDWINKDRWGDELEIITDVENITEQTVAIYAPKYDNSLAGLVCFIEYVERDENGKPLYVYYTDANGKKDTVKNSYTEGVDGIVIKESFESFKEKSTLKLIGYLKVKDIYIK